MVQSADGLDDIRAFNTGFKRCPVRPLLEDPDIGESLQRALDARYDPSTKEGFQHGAILKWLTSRGKPMTLSGIENHRNGVCSCAG